MKPRSTRSGSLSETRKAARATLESLTAVKRRSALVLVCSGDLGAGKTAFVKSLARELRVKGKVASPTFVIEKAYATGTAARKKFGVARLVHIDAYRLDDARELAQLGFKERLRDAGNLIVIEWGEKVKRLLPKKHAHLHFEFVDATTRDITRKK